MTRERARRGALFPSRSRPRSGSSLRWPPTDRSSSSVACTAGSPLTRGVGALRMAVVLDSDQPVDGSEQALVLEGRRQVVRSARTQHCYRRAHAAITADGQCRDRVRPCLLEQSLFGPRDGCGLDHERVEATRDERATRGVAVRELAHGVPAAYQCGPHEALLAEIQVPDHVLWDPARGQPRATHLRSGLRPSLRAPLCGACVACRGVDGLAGGGGVRLRGRGL